MFLKEISSDGNIQTVDVIFPLVSQHTKALITLFDGCASDNCAIASLSPIYKPDMA
ncbi:MAG: glutaminase domain-containing protein [Janthinobacterium lividum]